MIETDFIKQFTYDMNNLLRIKTGLPSIHWTIDERGLTNTQVNCGNCVGSCCMFFTVDHLSKANVRYLLNRGSVPIDFVMDNDSGINNHLLSRIAFFLALKSSSSNVNFSPLKFEQNEIKFATTCACQTCYGSCDIHQDKAHKPRICGNGYQVGLKCDSVFIALGSKAAIEVQNIFNKAEPWISLIAQATLGVDVKPRRFNFS